MENYRLEQTGQEVQDILNGAAMQQDLTAEVERAEGAEQTLQGNIDEEELRAKAAEETLGGAIGDEELRAKAAEEALGGAIDGINAKIPAGASSENQLADKDFVNSSIETATATFRGSYNLVSDLHLAVDATHAQIATLLGTVISEADNNDYSYVLVPTSAQTPTEIASIEKYTYGANGWAFAYALNNSGFTSAQWAAINSGITSGLVAKLTALPTNADLLLLLAGKQDVLTFDDVPVEGSTNPVKSGGVHSAIDDEKTARVNAVNAVAGRVDTIEGEIPATASSENKLVDQNQMNSSISTATATFRGAFNLVADLGLSVSATHEQIGTALAGEILTADNNDYAFVQVSTSDETPAQILKVERYKYNGTAWVFEYELNNSGFTSAQWAALNSGITSGLVAKLVALPTNDELVLALAGKQDVLTFDNTPTENSNNPVKSSGVYAADKALSDAIEAILLLIPSAATSLNKLVDTDLMNSSISTATATFRGTYNLVSDLSLDLTATHAQIATALAGEIATADNNDYAFVLVPTSVGTPTEIAQTDRYKFNGTAWAYEYTLNTSGFTSAQWAAINSGITAALVASLADIPDLIPSEATTSNQLADKAYVLASILAATPAFKGQFTTLAELQAVASPKDGDLGIVRTKDSDGMDVFTVYQYLNNAWGVFYSLSYHPQTKPATTGTTGDYPYNGMGRVELAKNMVNTGTELAPVYENQLTQDMFYKGAVGSRVPNTNTIFVIRYDFVLAENITIPDNCVLEFEGGSISGAHTITGTNTVLQYSKPFINSVLLAGTFVTLDIPTDTEIFIDQNYNTDRIKSMFNIYSPQNELVFKKNTYTDIEVIEFNRSVNVDFGGSTIKMKIDEGLLPSPFLNMTPVTRSSTNNYDFVYIKNVIIIGNEDYNFDNPIGSGVYRRAIQLFKVNDVCIENVTLRHYNKGTNGEVSEIRDRYELSAISIMYYVTAKISQFVVSESDADNIIAAIPEVNEKNFLEMANCHCNCRTGLLLIVDGRCNIHHNIIEGFNSSGLNAFCYDSEIHHNIFKDGTRSVAIDLSEGMYAPDNVLIYNNYISNSVDFFESGVGNVTIINNEIQVSNRAFLINAKILSPSTTINYNCAYNRTSNVVMCIERNKINAHSGIQAYNGGFSNETAVVDTKLKIINNEIICSVADNTPWQLPILVDYFKSADIIGNTIDGIGRVPRDNTLRAVIGIGSIAQYNYLGISGEYNIKENIVLTNDTFVLADCKARSFVWVDKVFSDTFKLNVCNNIVKNNLESGVFSFANTIKIYEYGNYGIPNFIDITQQYYTIIGNYPNNLNYVVPIGHRTFKSGRPIYVSAIAADNTKTWVYADGTNVS